MKPPALPRPTHVHPYQYQCARCDQPAEVSHPNGHGDQNYYCAAHEPPTLLTLIEQETDPT